MSTTSKIICIGLLAVAFIWFIMLPTIAARHADIRAKEGAEWAGCVKTDLYARNFHGQKYAIYDCAEEVL